MFDRCENHVWFERIEEKNESLMRWDIERIGNPTALQNLTVIVVIHERVTLRSVGRSKGNSTTLKNSKTMAVF